jgi:hypothetical protein
MRTYDPHKSTVDVRQADGHQTNKRVLVIATIAVIIAFALIYWWFAVYNPGASVNTHY